jgi:hypothetical protein
MRTATLATCLAGAALSACNRPAPEVPAACLTIPEAATIEMVKVTRITADGSDGAGWQIDTQPRIDALVAALRARSGGSCKTSVEKRVQEWSVALQSRDGVPLILWIGRDWIGGVDTQKDSKGWLIGRWRPLEPGERDELLDLLRAEGAPSTRSVG